MTEINTILQSWEVFNQTAFDVLRPIESEAHYQQVCDFHDDLSDRMETPEDPRYITLWRILAENIHQWESKHIHIEPSQPWETLQALMQERGLKQTDLGHLVAQPNLSRILQGKKEISRKLAVKLSEYFGVPVALFLS